MQRVKLFKSIETDIEDLERQINDWIESSGARVIHVFGNIAPQTAGSGSASTRKFDASDVLLAILYEVD